jgi:hypothetical protein
MTRKPAAQVLMTLSIILTLGVTGLLLTSASADNGKRRKGRDDGPQKKKIVFTVTHDEVVTLLTTADSDSHQLGDLRILTATPIYIDEGLPVGRLDAKLVTSTIDYPEVGDEIRMSVLNFVFGDNTDHFAGSSDQIIVSGSGFYPSQQSTIATGNILIRPVTGGSGRFFGATGSATTEHLADGTWRHTFDIEVF